MTTIRKIIRIFNLFLLAFLLAAGSIVTYFYFNQDKLISVFLKEADKHVNTRIYYDRVDVSFIQNFPDASIGFHKVVISGTSPEQGDTLANIGSLYFSFDIMKLIRGNYELQSLTVQDALISMKTTEDGLSNYDIIKKDTTNSGNSFSMDLKSIRLENVKYSYFNDQSDQNYKILVNESDASLSFKEELIDIQLKGDWQTYYLGFGNDRYFKDRPVNIDARLSYNKSTNKLSIKPSALYLHQSSFDISGFFQTGEKENTIDLNIDARQADIQTLLSLLPSNIYKKLSAYKSSGEVYFKGKISGKTGEGNAPGIMINFGCKNASFYHPEFDQKITEANLTGSYTNGKNRDLSSSVLSLKNISIKLDGNTLKGDLRYARFNDPYVNASLITSLPVKTALTFYPLEKLQDARGNVSLNVEMNGRLKDLESRATVQKVDASGEIRLKDLSFILKDNSLEYRDINGYFIFNKSDLAIDHLNGKAGKTDFQVSGMFRYFISYLLTNKLPLRIEAGVQSDYIDLDEILSSHVTGTQDKSSKPYYFSVNPDVSLNLDCRVKELKFRNIKGEYALKNLTGNLLLNDQILTLQNIKSNIAGGSVLLYANVDATMDSSINVTNRVSMKDIRIDHLFYMFENFDQKFITDNNVRGLYHGSFNGSMQLSKTLDIDAGSVYQEIAMDIEDGVLKDIEPLEDLGSFLRLKNLDKYVKNSDFSRVEFSRLTNNLVIRENTIEIPNMNIKSTAADLSVSGKHYFDHRIDYRLAVPLINYKKREREKEYGAIEEVKSNNFKLFLTITGTTEDYEVALDSKKSFKHTVETIKDDLKDVNDPFKLEPDDPEVVAPDDSNYIEFD